MTSTTQKFLNAFDARDKEHVTWLKKMIDLAATMNNPNSSIQMVNSINSNPFGVNLPERDALDWPHIHFVLCAHYAKAVLCGKAYIPSS